MFRMPLRRAMSGRKAGLGLAIFGTALGFFVGLSLGLLGGGGSVLTVPIFVYVLGVDPRAAIAASFVVVGASALVGALRHARNGNVHGRTAIGFGLVASVGAFAGGRLAFQISEILQLVLFATVMLIAAILMYRGRSEPADDAADQEPRPWSVVTPVALAVGVLTGLVGVGGGFMIVPALVLLLRIPMKHAVGTSLLVIAINATSGFSAYAGSVEIPWGVLLPFAGLSIVGIFAGARLMQSASPKALKKGFAIFLMVVAVLILVQNAIELGAA